MTPLSEAGVTLTLQMKHRGPEGTHQLCRVVQFLSADRPQSSFPAASESRRELCACPAVLAPPAASCLLRTWSGAALSMPQPCPRGSACPHPPPQSTPGTPVKTPASPFLSPLMAPGPSHTRSRLCRGKSSGSNSTGQLPSRSPHTVPCSAHTLTPTRVHTISQPTCPTTLCAPEATKTSLDLQVGTNRSKSKSLLTPFSGFGETRPERVSLDTGAQFPALIRKEAIILPPLAGQPPKPDLLLSGADAGWDLHGFCCS